MVAHPELKKRLWCLLGNAKIVGEVAKPSVWWAVLDMKSHKSSGYLDFKKPQNSSSSDREYVSP